MGFQKIFWNQSNLLTQNSSSREETGIDIQHEELIEIGSTNTTKYYLVYFLVNLFLLLYIPQ